MLTMRRTLIQFDEPTFQRLREIALQRELSISAVVRDMVSKTLGTRPGRNDRTSVRRFRSVGIGSSRQGKLAPVSEHHDEALTQILKK